jgi:hypothetical protein
VIKQGAKLVTNGENVIGELLIDDIVERSDLNSSEVLATLFDLEMKGVVRQSPGLQFSKVLFYRQIRCEPRSLILHLNVESIPKAY